MLKVIKEYLIEEHYLNRIDEFEEAFNSHPNYPSLFAVTDSLTLVGIENVAARIDKQELDNLPNRFLAMVQNNLVLVKKDNDQIILRGEDGKSKTQKKDDFIEQWDGIVVAVEVNEISAKDKISFNKEVLLGLTISGLFLFKIVLDHNFSFSTIITFFLGLLGLFISVLIIQDKFGSIKNPSVSKFCNQNSLTSCDNVLGSTYSKINKWLEFTDLPILYFSTVVISMLINSSVSNEVILVSCITFPIVIYSIWLQKVKIKKWCPLCLVVSSVLVMTSLLVLFGYQQPNFKNGYLLLVVLVVVLLTWSLLKNEFDKNKKVQEENTELKKFKRNPELFLQQLKLVSAETNLERFNKIVIGNNNAPVTITLILSPSCSHCHTAYVKGLELYEKFKETLKIEIFYNLNPHNSQNNYIKVALIILKINQLDKNKALQAIDDWHNKKMALSDWLSKWEIESVEENKDELEKQYEWCQENNFNYTPVRLINNQKISNEYSIDDLKYFVNELIPQEELED